MNELYKTLTFVAVALLLTGAAFVSTRDRDRGRTRSSTTRASRSSPTSRTRWLAPTWKSSSFEPSTATATRFRVMFKDKKWVIPSHYDYPADAKDRLSKTAAARHGPDQGHDPLRQRRGPGGDGRDRPARRQGHDASRGGASGSRSATPPRRSSPTSSSATRSRDTERKDGGGQHYVRVPGQKRTYGVNVKAELSTRFADWIETNLLKVESQPRSARSSSTTTRSRKTPTARPTDAPARREGRRSRGRTASARGRWTRPARGTKSWSEDKLRTLTDALGDLKIVGVRPKPPGLKNLDQEDLKLTPADRRYRSRTRASS